MRLDLAEFLKTASRWQCPNLREGCTWGQKRADAYFNFLGSFDLSRLLRCQISSIIPDIEGATFEEDLRKRTPCGYGDHGPLTPSETFEAKLAAFKKRAALCMNCVRAGKHCGAQHDCY